MEDNITNKIIDKITSLEENVDYLTTLVAEKKPTHFLDVNGIRLTSPCDKLLEALSKMQGNLENAKKESENPFFKSKYADLNTCLQTAKKVMAENGLCVSQHCTFDGNIVQCVTVLGHSSGQMMVSTLNVPVTKKDPQGIGMAITYARRYAFSSVIGLAQADDDAESSVVHEDKQETRQEAPKQETFETATDKQVKLINTICGKHHVSVESILARYNVAALNNLSKPQASECIRILKKQCGEE